MPRAKPPEEPKGLDLSDPRRQLKLRRLREERDRIPTLAGRAPAIRDPEFDEWKGAVSSLLVEIFGSNEFVICFERITFRPISYSMMSDPTWYADPVEAWATGLAQADKVVREALEEGEIAVGLPPMVGPRQSGPAIHVTVNNQNVFSPSIHVTVEQLISQLDAMPLSPAEKAEVKNLITDLDAETQGAKRWPMIARTLEALKSFGKSVYKDIAVPLLVEFLKQESGLKGGSAQ